MDPKVSAEVPTPSTMVQRHGRDTSSWGKGKKKNSFKPRMPRTNVYAPRIENSDGVIPVGRHLSTVPSELNNDPLSQKSYFPGPSQEFKEIAQREKIFSSCTALPLICEESYTNISTNSPTFGKTTPRSAYDYYVAVLTYHRLLHLHFKNGGNLTLGELNFIQHMENNNFTVPKSLHLYLSGFGNCKAPKSRELRFTFLKPTLNADIFGLGGHDIYVPGFFGPILANLGLYSGYPCLAVYVFKILHDLYRTEHREHPPIWNLPVLSRSTFPLNSNCLGYRLNEPLSLEHRMFYENANFTLRNAEFSNDQLPINNELLTAVHIKLCHSKMTLYPSPSSTLGSVGQLCRQSIVNQTTHRCVTAHFVGESAFEMPSSEGWFSSSFLYNVEKTYRDAVVLSICPITFPEQTVLPDHRIQNLDILRSLSATWLSPTLYATVEFSPTIRVEKIVRQDTSTA